MRKLIQTDKKVNAWNTFIIKFENKFRKQFNIVLPLCNFETEESYNRTNVIFHSKLSKIDLDGIKKLLNFDEGYFVVADYTDDPTTNTAGGIVSLGYPLIRVTFQDSKISSFNPLIVSGITKNFNVMHNRCQRSSLIKMPKYETIKKDIRINKLTVKRDYYIMPVAYEKPVYTVSCITGIENLTNVSLLDMTTFYNSPQVIYAKKHRTIEAAHKDYKRLKEVWKN